MNAVLVQSVCPSSFLECKHQQAMKSPAITFAAMVIVCSTLSSCRGEAPEGNVFKGIGNEKAGKLGAN